MPLKHIEHFLVAADDIDATRDWYARVLGMRSGPHPDFGFPVHWMYLGEVDIVHIGPSAKGASEIQKKYLGRTSQDAGTGTGAIDHIAFRATGLRDMLVHLKKEKISFTQRRANGQALFQLFFHDPNGIKIELNYDAAEAEGIAPELMASELIAGVDTRAAGLAAAVVLLASLVVPPVAHAQDRARPVVGVLTSTQLTSEVREAFTSGLREQGYREKDIEIVWRAADGNPARAKSAAEELVGRKVNVLVTVLTPASMAAKNATRDIPIVLAWAGDPVATGLVSNLARPGGNITGLSGNAVELSGKRIEVLREMMPGMTDVGLMILGTDPFAKPFVAETDLAARKLGLRLHIVDVRSSDKVDAAIAELKQRGAQAVIVQGALTAPSWRVAELALQHKLPSMSPQRRFAGDGGMMYHGANLADGVRRAAFYVHKILKGAKPGDLPIEQPSRFELVINTRTAKALGVAIPQQLLLRADQVIE